jgi:hypothetical protein
MTNTGSFCFFFFSKRRLFFLPPALVPTLPRAPLSTPFDRVDFVRDQQRLLPLTKTEPDPNRQARDRQKEN